MTRMYGWTPPQHAVTRRVGGIAAELARFHAYALAVQAPALSAAIVGAGETAAESRFALL